MSKYRILSFLLSFLIFVSSLYQLSFISYAGGGASRGDNDVNESSGVYEPGTPTINKVLDEASTYLVYLASRLGCIVNYDFAKYIQTKDDYIEWWNTGHISVNEEKNEINFSNDLVDYIKQALREYNEETNGFYLLSTPSIMELDPTLFSNRNMYISLQNFINKYGIVAYYISSNYMFVADVSSILDGTYNVTFGNISTTPLKRPDLIFPLYFYNSYWEKHIYYNCTRIYFSGDNNQIFTEIPENNVFTRELSYAGLLNINRKMATSSYLSIISKDGCRIRVFKSENAMKVYSVGERTVYFGTDFYEKEPTEITITIDDLDKYLDTDFDKYFGELKDTIISQGSNLSEREIEKLTDSILGKLTDIDNSIGEVGDSVKDTNNLLSQVLIKLDNLDKNVSNILTSLDNKVSSTLEFDFSGIEERLDTIIASLGIISGQLDNMTAEEIEQRTDDMLNEMQLEFSDIGEVAKTKFPLSLPWDLGKAFDKISGGDITSGESPPEAVAMLLYDEPDKFVHTMSLYDDNGISLYASEDTDSSQGGGYFPSMEFSTDSLRGTDNGGHISSGGHEHGGGGASRWGAWHSDTGAPIFYIPVEFSQNMKIGGMLIIDLSGFEVLHSIGRLMFSIIFCMNLVHLTFKAITAGKDVLTW